MDTPRGQVFGNDNVSELRPHAWKQQIVGKGSFGIVYKATWHKEDVAVKEIMLPPVPHEATAAAKERLRANVRKVIREFGKEVEVCCQFSHPNIVRMLGWATDPELCLVQEFMRGQSLHIQLHLEAWRPTLRDQLKVALDVANGMAYLHGEFEKPIIHRDLKSGNLMLEAVPTEGVDVVVKITDFGLTRESHIDSTMTASTVGGAAGSMLWMAPELVLGEKYTEKVDVFSYAMCLVELVDRNVPWHGSGVGQQVIPVRVTQGKRPTHQVREAHAPLKQLIAGCWAGNTVEEASRRPSFAEIARRVEEMLAGCEAAGPAREGSSRPASPPRESVAELEVAVDGASRPASPERGRGGSAGGPAPEPEHEAA